MSGSGELELERAPLLDARRFEMAVKRLADSLGYGSDRSPFVGPGLDYVQSRAYQPGDPVKAIDWRVTARAGRPFVKEYEAPRRMPVVLVVDTSASMAVSSLPRSKYATAVQIAGGLALAALERMSPVGLIGAGERTLRVAPSLSRERVYEWLHGLRRYRVDEATTLGHGLARLTPSLAERSLVLVLSDLHDPAARAGLERLAQVHDVAVLQLRDPAEDGLQGAGLLRAREAETGRPFVVRGARAGVDRADTARALRRSGIDHLLLRTDGPVAVPLRQFLKARGLLGRGAR